MSKEQKRIVTDKSGPTFCKFFEGFGFFNNCEWRKRNERNGKKRRKVYEKKKKLLISKSAREKELEKVKTCLKQ